MATVTFMSDFGEVDHYVAAVKAAILSENPGQSIIDISHKIRQHDIGHAAYVIKQVYSSFPANTVHLIAVDPVQDECPALVAVRLNDHYFISHDSGIFNLIDSQSPVQSVELPSKQSTFPCRDFLATAAACLAKGKALSELGVPKPELQIKIPSQPKTTKREIIGQVDQVDHYGNLITNINRIDFETITKLLDGNPTYRIRFRQERLTQIHLNFNDVESGECVALFNAYGLLEIGINKGRAADLLGLQIGVPVMIEFNPD